MPADISRFIFQATARAAGLFAIPGSGKSIRARFLLPLLAVGLAPGCQSAKPPDFEPLIARLFLEVRPGEPGLAVQLPVSGVGLTVAARPVLVEYDIRNAELARVELGQCLLLQLTPPAARDLARLSGTGLGRRLVLFLNGVPVGARRLERMMPDGTLLFFVEKPDAELPLLVARLKRTSSAIAAAAAGKS